jgi:hypothetical protein
MQPLTHVAAEISRQMDIACASDERARDSYHRRARATRTCSRRILHLDTTLSAALPFGARRIEDATNFFNTVDEKRRTAFSSRNVCCTRQESHFKCGSASYLDQTGVLESRLAALHLSNGRTKCLSARWILPYCL